MAPELGARRRRPTVSTEKYAAFIAQIELVHVWVRHAAYENHYGPQHPHMIDISVEDAEPEFENQEDGFHVYVPFDIRIQAHPAGLDVATIRVTFGLRFTSRQRMTKALFALFSEHNLPVNVWPYLREFVGNAVVRMGWPPLTLPTLKRGIAAEVPGAVESEQ